VDKRPLAILYKFGGAVKVAGIHRYDNGSFRFGDSVTPPATIEQVAEAWWHRISGTTPGNPKYYDLLKSRIKSEDFKNREFSRGSVKFKPGAAPVLPSYAKRLEDIEGFEE
jgi:hypothetical protein